MIVTIVGFSPHDSGKTRLAARLARVLRERGVRLAVVKPLGGHNVWDQHFSIRYALDKGVLVGGDAIRLARAVGAEPHVIEPVDMLLAPPDVERFLTRLRDYLMLLESLEAQVVALRVNICTGDRIEHVHMVVEDNVASTPPGIRGLLGELLESLEPKPTRITAPQLHEALSSGNIVTAADVCTSRLIEGAEVALIESYNDALIPVPTVLRSTLFIAVGPGRAVVYRGRDVVQATRLYASFRPGATRTSEILHLLRPVASIPLDFVYDDESMGEDVEKLADTILSYTTSSS